VNVPRLVARLYGTARNIRNDLRDLADVRFVQNARAKGTPYGFLLAGSRSTHHRAMQEGRFEAAEVDVLNELFVSADVFVDVGANIGFYSCLARARGAYVIAVEPQPMNLKFLYANLVLNGWPDVEVFPVGVAAQPALATLFGASTTGASLIPGWAGQGKHITQTVPLSTIDILLGSRFAGKRIVIKVDIEGAEYSALRGATTTLRSRPSPAWLVEICLNEFHPVHPNPDYLATFDLFWDQGYEAWTTGTPRRRLERADVKRWSELVRSESGLSKSGLSESRVINYLFLRSDAMAPRSSEDATTAASHEPTSRGASV
jgi:FkbM family methyltransferase